MTCTGKQVAITGISFLTPCGSSYNEIRKTIEKGISGITQPPFSLIPEIPLAGLGLLPEKKYPFMKNRQTAPKKALSFLFNRLSLDTHIPITCLAEAPFFLGSAFPGIHIDRVVSPQDFFSPNETYISTNACAAGNYALYTAFSHIATGRITSAVCGGIDFLTPYMISGFYNLKILAKTVSVPFSKSRNGLTLGEGGALFYVESLTSARKRNATIYAIIDGFGISCDKKGITGMDSEGKGIIRAIKNAFSHSREKHPPIDYISSHGTGTIVNDKTEAKAITSCFSDTIPITAAKSYWGHTMGGAAALEAALLALNIYHNEMFPILNLHDPDFSLYFVHQLKKKTINYALSLASGFGGINSALLLKKGEIDG